jgi:hypothetical protein
MKDGLLIQSHRFGLGILILSLFLSVADANAARRLTPADKLIDIYMRETALPLVVAGIKPFIWDEVFDEANLEKAGLKGKTPQEFFASVDEAVRDGRLVNPDLLFFVSNDGLHFGSRKSIQKLVRNTKASAILSSYGIKPPKTVDGWLDLFKSTEKLDVRDIAQQFKFDIIMGVAMGYPPLEVEAYAVRFREELIATRQGKNVPSLGELAKGSVDVLGDGGMNVAGYFKFLSAKKTAAEIAFEKEGNQLMKNYRKIRKLGKPPIEAVNEVEFLRNPCAITLKPSQS